MSRNSRAKRHSKKALEKRKANQKKARIQSERLKIPTIYIDESGNSGSNLLDHNQPVFTLASCKYSAIEASSLLKLVNSRSPHELHFKNLKRRKAGQDGIVRLMSHKLINLKNFKINVFLKEFMITTKIVDMLIESMMHTHGEDLYLNGQNIALSNVLYYCLPTFCDAQLVQKMYKNFVDMVRDVNESNINAFYDTVEKVKDSSCDEKFKSDVNLIYATRRYVHDALEKNDKAVLDPSIPAFFSHCIFWGKAYPKGFHIIHDDSHSIEKERVLFAQFMDWTQKDIELGYDRRTFNLPLKGKSLKFGRSDQHPQLQVSDIISSSFSYWASKLWRGETEDYLFQQLNELNLDQFIGNNKIWPTTDVTPEDLNTVYKGGINAVNNIPYFMEMAVPNPNVVGS